MQEVKHFRAAKKILSRIYVVDFSDIVHEV